MVEANVGELWSLWSEYDAPHVLVVDRRLDRNVFFNDERVVVYAAVLHGGWSSWHTGEVIKLHDGIFRASGSARLT